MKSIINIFMLFFTKCPDSPFFVELVLFFLIFFIFSLVKKMSI